MSADALRQRVKRWSAKLAVEPTQVRIQSMTRKWASCSSKGCLTFSLELASRQADFQDYVVVHELLHMRLPNHGKLFSATLRAHLPSNRHAKQAQANPASNGI